MRRFCCILLSVSLIICASVPCFATSNWNNNEVDTVVLGVQSIDTKMSNLYTALSNIYTYITNNGNGIREGISALYTNSNTTNERLQYLMNIGYVITGYLDPIAGDGKTIAQQLLDIRTNQLSIGGQVGDVSSKLVTTNGYLATSDASLTNIKSNISNLYNSNRVYKGSAANISFKGLSTDNETYSLSNASGDIVYCKVTFTLTNYFTNGDSILIVTLPVTPNLVNYVELIDLYDSNAIPDLFLCDYNTYSTTFYLRLLNGTTPNTFIFAFHMKDGTSVQQRVRYAGNTVSPSINFFYDDPNHNSIQYYNLISDLYTLKNSKLIEEQTEAIKSLANEFNGSNGIIQDDSDTVIVVDFDSDTGSDVSNFILTIQDFFDTGVSIGELTLALNSFSQMPWFTSLETYNTVNSQGAYYKDLYDD